MKKLSLFYFLIALLFCGIAQAQTSVDILGDNLSYKSISQRLKAVDAGLKSRKITSDEISEDIRYINEIRPQLQSRRKDVESQIKFIEKRLEALGNNEGGKEVQVIAQKRQEFNREMATERARISEIDILLAKLDELDMAIFNLRNEELWGNLLKSGSPLIYPSAFLEANRQLLSLVFDIIKSPLTWYEELTAAQKSTFKAKILPVSLVVLFMGFLGFLLRRFIFRRFGYRDEIEQPRYGRKVIAAIAVWIAYGIIPTFLIGAGLVWIISGKILTNGFFGITLNSFLYYSLYVIMLRAICRVVFTPYHENWRLINMPSEKARRVTKALYISIYLIGFMAYLQHIIEVSNYPIELMGYLVAVSAIIKSFCVVWVASRILWSGNTASGSSVEDLSDEDDETAETEDEKRDNNAFRVTFALLVLALGITGLSLSGYAYLASFIMNNFISSVLVIFVLWVFRKIIYEFIHRILFLGLWVKTFRMRRHVIRKLDFWLGFVIEPLFVIGGIFAVLVLWGVPADVLINMFYRAFTGFTVGGIRISLISIIIGLVVFFICIAIIKSLRFRLENRLLAKMDMDEGTKHSLAAGFSSLGYVASALLAIAIMGGNLTNFALVAGALSVGIGLGLQNVVNNFVSGIILLFERPIKVGDWVVINGEEGKIKQINIRSTEVETFNRASVIIPNATLLSTSVTNLTHGNNWMRFKVAVGVAYGSNTQRVKEILLECAAAHKKVLKKPEPYVLFQNFGASSLDFELRGYSSNIWDGWDIPSDLRYEINRRFAEEGIEIPFAQMVIHRGSEVGQETQEQFYASKKKREKKNADK
ncbi:MAG: mechanosensitive ion channel family protein [Proteobacteria bacterium]|nr:mechanosensitive ion channel family protein [Pseudomonadota bacterium]